MANKRPGHYKSHNPNPGLQRVGICRYGACQKPGKGKPPFCKLHAPGAKPATTIPWPIPLKKLMAGKA